MKTICFVLIISCFALSCTNAHKQQNVKAFKESTLKSDILIQTHASISFSKPDKIDEVSLTISGNTILNGMATFKVLNDSGQEIHCETFPVKKLIQPEYRTANRVLQELHIKEVVEGYFVNSEKIKIHDSLLYVSL